MLLFFLHQAVRRREKREAIARHELYILMLFEGQSVRFFIARQGPPVATLYLMTVRGGPRQLRTDQKLCFTDWLLLLMLPAPPLRHAPAAATTGVMAPPLQLYFLRLYPGAITEAWLRPLAPYLSLER